MLYYLPIAKKILRRPGIHSLLDHGVQGTEYVVHIVTFSVNFKMAKMQPKSKAQPPHLEQAAGLEHETPARCVYFLQG